MPILADLYAHPDYGQRPDAELWAEMRQLEAELNAPPPPAPRQIVFANYQRSRDGRSTTEILQLGDGTTINRAFKGEPSARRKVGELLP